MKKLTCEINSIPVDLRFYSAPNRNNQNWVYHEYKEVQSEHGWMEMSPIAAHNFNHSMDNFVGRIFTNGRHYEFFK